MNVVLENELTEMFSELEPKGKRIFGMHDGQGFISDDFNDELGDEFWYGEDFGIIKKDDETQTER